MEHLQRLIPAAAPAVKPAVRPAARTAAPVALRGSPAHRSSLRAPGPAAEALRAARRAAVVALAAAASQLVAWGWLGATVLAMRLLVAAGLAGLLVDAVVHMAATGRAAAAGALVLAAGQLGALSPVQQLFTVQAVQHLCTRLLTEGHVAAAAAVAGTAVEPACDQPPCPPACPKSRSKMLPPTAEASWSIAGHIGWLSSRVALLLAPPVVAAVDGGRAGAVAAVLCLLFAARVQPLLMWLVVEIVATLERPDAAAAAAWEAMQLEGGAGALHSLLFLGPAVLRPAPPSVACPAYLFLQMLCATYQRC